MQGFIEYVRFVFLPFSDLRILDLVLPPNFKSFLMQLKWKWYLGMTLVDCPSLTCILEGWLYHCLVDLQLDVKSVSIPPETFVQSIQNATLAFAVLAVILRECVPERGMYQQLAVLSLHIDGWFAARLSMCRLLYYLSLFWADCKVKVVTCLCHATHSSLNLCL